MMAMIKNIGNEFSHPNENNKTHYLLYSLTLNLYEIANWMFRYIEEHPYREENLKKCTKIEKPTNDDLEGIIEVHKIYHVGRKFGVSPGFVLKNGWLGKKVRIVKYGVNNDENLKTLYPYFASNIQLVEEPENGSK
jgi:hypothetical protein